MIPEEASLCPPLQEGELLWDVSTLLTREESPREGTPPHQGEACSDSGRSGPDLHLPAYPWILQGPISQ